MMHIYCQQQLPISSLQQQQQQQQQQHCSRCCLSSSQTWTRSAPELAPAGCRSCCLLSGSIVDTSRAAEHVTNSSNRASQGLLLSLKYQIKRSCGGFHQLPDCCSAWALDRSGASTPLPTLSMLTHSPRTLLKPQVRQPERTTKPLNSPVPLSRMERQQEAQFVGSVPWSPASVADGSFRQRVAQLARLGHPSMHLWLPSSEEEGSSQCVSREVIRALGVLYDTVSEVDPRMLVVPMLEFAGWDQGAVASVSGAHTVACNDSTPAASHSTISTPDQERVLYPEIIPVQASSFSENCTAHDGTSGSVAQGWGLQGVNLAFDHVAVGGTFDRLHCGHELLLASTALLASKTVYVGITADKLLSKKNHRELLQPYDQRCDAAVGFMRAVRPGLRVQSGALTDPNEPTQAELDPAMQALVVSQETLPGAVRINEGRVARGFAPLLVLVVPVIGCKDPGHKLSSTALRALDAARLVTAR